MLHKKSNAQVPTHNTTPSDNVDDINYDELTNILHGVNRQDTHDPNSTNAVEETEDLQEPGD